MTPAHAASEYRFTPIPLLDGTTHNEGVAINNRGDVAGNASELLIKTNGFIWNKRHGLEILPASSHSPSTRVFDLNERGDASGWTRDVNDEAIATIWIKGRTYQQLGTHGGPSSIGFALNNARTVVGGSLPNNYATQNLAAVWVRDAMPYNPDADMYGRSIATDINQHGDVVGYVTYFGSSFGFVVSEEYGYYNTRVDYLHRYTQFHAINDGGWITGSISFSPNDSDLLLTNTKGDLVPVETGNYKAVGRGINNHNTIVGQCWDYYSYDTRAMVWNQTNGMRDLNDLTDLPTGWSLVVANDINDRGQIVGKAIVDDRTARGFLLTPNPEPTTATIFLILYGINVLGSRRSRDPILKAA